MTEQGGDGRKLTMASSSSTVYHPYPLPLAKYEDVVACPKLFMDTLGKLHATMGTKFMIPIIGGKDLDLHRLFVEVTSRGGIEKVLRERRWKEVTAIFSFPSSATNASFILRKYYVSLLHHYEQIYLFKAKGWAPLHADALQNVSTVLAPPRGLAESVMPSCGIQAAVKQSQKIHTTVVGAAPSPSMGSQVAGVIDGKFDNGYLITVTIGSEKLKGVLYQTPQNPAHQVSQHQVPQCQNVSANNNINSPAASCVLRRRRRKKSEMRKRDPSHPKPNRSGYNFFFAEQHARLKPLYPGKDREISRMIGELWNKLKEHEKTVYQEKAVKDKERYRIEMEDYNERLRMGQIISDAVPIQQRLLESDVNMMELDEENDTECTDSSHINPDNEMSSGRSNLEDDKTVVMGTSPRVEIGAENVGVETLGDEEGFQLQKRLKNVGDEDKECLIRGEAEEQSLPSEEKVSVVIKEK